MKTPKIFALIFALLLVAATANAGDKIINLPSASSVPGNTAPEYVGPLTVAGPLTMTESLGPELWPTACGSFTLGTDWTCSAGPVFPHATPFTGSLVSVTSAPLTTGRTYKVTYTMTRTAGALQVNVGGVAGAVRSAAGTYTDYVPAGAAATLNFQATASYNGTLSAVSVKEDLSVITPSAGPVRLYKELANATANEAAVSIVAKQTGAGGNKTALRVESIGSGTGTEYIQEWYADGVRNASITAPGTYYSATGSYGSGGGIALVPTGASAASMLVTLNSATNASTSGAIVATKIAPTYNQASGTAANTDLLISRTETALGSGAQKMISLQAGAAGTTEVYYIDNAGDSSGIGNHSTSSSFLSTRAALGSTPAFRHSGTATSWGNVFADTGTVGVMNGSDVLNIFDAAITNSNHTGTGNEVNGFNAGAITGDAEATESAVKVGTGWDYEMAGPGVFKKSFTKTPLTNNSATDLFTVTLAAGEVVTGKLFYGLNVTGGTNDLQAHSGELTFVCVNKGGTVTKDIDEVYLAASETVIVTAGTFADTWAMKAGDVCTVTLNMDSNLSSAVNTVIGEIMIHSAKPITLN